MNIKCILGNHNWTVNCEKCIKCGHIRNEQHNWSGCICLKCIQTRDEQHNWSVNCEKCSRCGKTRENPHDWSKDCKNCSKCREYRGKEEHDWNGCRCSKCEQTRDEQHDWSGCKCSKCGHPRDKQYEPHDWSGCKCSKCGQTRDEQHEWKYDGYNSGADYYMYKCVKCGICVPEHMTDIKKK